LWQLANIWHTDDVVPNDGIRVTVGPQGRLVLPAPVRRQLDIKPGDVLVVWAEEDRLVLESRDAILARIRRRLSVVPPQISLVDELIAERRKETEKET
jgi:AbrB family looped-hinge helix DNA binding protein